MIEIEKALEDNKDEEETMQKVLLLKLNATGKPGVGFWKMET